MGGARPLGVCLGEALGGLGRAHAEGERGCENGTRLLGTRHLSLCGRFTPQVKVYQLFSVSIYPLASLEQRT